MQQTKEKTGVWIKGISAVFITNSTLGIMKRAYVKGETFSVMTKDNKGKYSRAEIKLDRDFSRYD